MNDTQMLDWVQNNVFKISQRLNDNFFIEFYTEDVTHKEVQGSTLRECILKANPDSKVSLIEYAKTLCSTDSSDEFMFDGNKMKAVISGSALCNGCDFYNKECVHVNRAMEQEIGKSCGIAWHIKFVNQTDKENYFED